MPNYGWFGENKSTIVWCDANGIRMHRRETEERYESINYGYHCIDIDSVQSPDLLTAIDCLDSCRADLSVP